MLLCLVECLDCSNDRLKLNKRVDFTFLFKFLPLDFSRIEGKVYLLFFFLFFFLSLSLVFELSRISIHTCKTRRIGALCCFKCVFRGYSETLSFMKQMARVSWLEAQRKENCILVQVFCVTVPEFCVIFTSCSRIITLFSPFVIILKLKPTLFMNKELFSGSKDKEKRLPCVHRPH